MGLKNVYAIGDISIDTLRIPKTAFLAELQGKLAAKNAMRRAKGQPELKNIEGITGKI